MDGRDVIGTLRRHEPNLRARGVRHVALFGSLARGDDHAASDIDLLIDVDPEIVRDLYGYAGLKTFIAKLFERPVDVVDRSALPPAIRSNARADERCAF